MATIPLPVRSEAPRAAPLSRIPVASDNRNLARLGAVAMDAHQQPLLPKDMFRGDQIAGNAWGEALQNLGKAGAALSMEFGRIQNEKDILEWDGKIDETAASYRTSLATNPDPRTWQPGWMKQVEGLKKSLSTDKNLSPAARHQIEMRLGKYASDESVRLQFGAMRENLRQVNIGYDTEEKRSLGAGRIDLARGYNRDAFEKGFRSEADYEAKEVDYNLAERSQNLENLIGNDVQSARNAASLFSQKGTLAEYGLGAEGNQYEKQQWLRKAEGAIAFHEALNADRVASLIAEGKIRSNEELEIFKDDLSPKAYSDLAERMNRGVVNDDSTYVNIAAVISGYSAASDPNGLEKSRIEERIITKFDGPKKDELKRQLDERFEATQEGVSPADETVRASLSEVAKDMDAGKYGVFKIQYDGKNIRWNEERGEWTRAPFSWEDWKPETEWTSIDLDQDTKLKLSDPDTRKDMDGKIVEDLSAKKRAGAKAASIQSDLIKKVKTRELKSGAEVLEHYRKETEAPTLNDARSILNQAPVTGDLPDTSMGGSIDPSLFQQIYNQTR
jgi:hypothetical protein